MKTACHYSVVRFMPFAETEEFANVGVVLFAPRARYFGFRLMSQRHKRITDFFEQVEGRIYRALMRDVRDELDRISEAFKVLGTDRRLRNLDTESATGLWNELIKPRESLIRFSEGRVALTDDPTKQLELLFGHYVERNFVTREYREQTLEKNVWQVLRAAHLSSKFTSARVGNDEYHVTFPLVAFEHKHAERAIKPLSLTQADSARIIEHGAAWAARIRNLRKRGLLPDRVLFAVDGDHEIEGARARARADAIAELKELEVEVIPISARDKLIRFASQDSTDHQ